MDPVSDPIVDPWINQPDFDDVENDVILGARRKENSDEQGEGREGNRRRKKGKKGKGGGGGNGGQNQSQGGGKKSKGKGGGGGGGDKGAKEYERFAPVELSQTELEAAIASVVEDPSLREPEKEEIEEVPSEVEIQKMAFLQKCDGVLAHREAWKAEATILRQKDSPSIDEQLRKERLMKRLTLVMYYERFQNAVKEIDELKEKLKALQEEQRQDAIRLKAILKHTEATQEERKKREDAVKAAQKAFDIAKAASEEAPTELNKSVDQLNAQEALDAAKADQAALQELPENWEQIQAGLVRRMRNRTESIDEGNDTFVDLTEKLEKMMGDLAIVEHEAGNLDDPQAPEGEPAIGEQTGADRVADQTLRVARATGQGAIKAAKVGGKVGYIGGMGTLAVGAGLLSIPGRFVATQLERLYRFSMNPSVFGKGVDRIKKFYQDEGLWDGTNDAVKWLLLGDPQKEEKKKEKK